ncbi:putative Zn peptidase [Bifidobacterium saguini DSM 23967]|uniref:ImmA/IrrE family metallo-endopeptidase n=2 Tax=Bifidobacterium saguini TaxID=762210 RepID=A0ABX7SB20_9BIFI|nr:ImmA/IrrE family metallo-endopeptidase [Bifidobacterium saguini]KFI93331.1 putative Zn peptidase [Bifidobacterium saguini DSM 23967]QTB90544.1 ImmA/IrrE family metallo-endopeptidase [Bifidobacterium saguini]
MLAATYRWVEEQVELMLNLATSTHPKTFLRDCLNDPFGIAQHWKRKVQVQLINRSAYSVAEKDEDSDISGLCMQPEQTVDGKYHLIVNQCGYLPRDYFTLLHELGHYLQRTDDELIIRRTIFNNIAMSKEAEEAACNLFASKALMPDELIAEIGDFHKASTATTLYTRSQASRPAVARRIAALLDNGWVTILDPTNSLKVRAFADDHREYGLPLELELRAVERFREQEQSKKRLEEYTFTDSYTAQEEHDTKIHQVNVSIAPSWSGRRNTFMYIIVNEGMKSDSSMHEG